MKVVLFCGGQGMRLREFSESIPKPMVPIGYRPILWHVMKYYAQFGHTEFILCLGHQGNVIKNYFLNYNEALSNDFVLSEGGDRVELLAKDIQDWRITFVDTGLESTVGERLRRVAPYLEGEEYFLANYADGLCNADLDDMVHYTMQKQAVACMIGVRSSQSFHIIESDEGGTVRDISPVAESRVRINGGFFVMHSSIFRYMREGEDLLAEPFARLMKEGRLVAYDFDDFWACMDTFKEKRWLEELYHEGTAPWMIWDEHASHAAKPVLPVPEGSR